MKVVARPQYGFDNGLLLKPRKQRGARSSHHAIMLRGGDDPRDGFSAARHYIAVPLSHISQEKRELAVGVRCGNRFFHDASM